MSRPRTSNHYSASDRRQQGIAPTYGQGLALRNLLPGLTAHVTGTRPCDKCGRATAAPKVKICARCKAAA